MPIGITYDSIHTDLDAVLKRIALAGYDNEKYLAPDKAYAGLDGCCQYERTGRHEVVNTAGSAAAGISPTESMTQQPNEESDHLKPVFDAYFALKDALVATNSLLAERRNFIEAVLSGVSAGVIGLDSVDRITLVSRSAERLLGFSSDDVIGKPLAEVVPEFAEVLTAREETSLKAKGQREIKKQTGDEERTFAVMVTRERAGEGDVGSVVTFDDISELVQAQRTSAWADVARRIAHEIKNPLTPIQLSAERLRNKFAKQLTENRELFETLTQTIERQTGTIKTMVDEIDHRSARSGLQAHRARSRSALLGGAAARPTATSAISSAPARARCTSTWSMSSASSAWRRAPRPPAWP